MLSETRFRCASVLLVESSLAKSFWKQSSETRRSLSVVMHNEKRKDKNYRLKAIPAINAWLSLSSSLNVTLFLASLITTVLFFTSLLGKSLLS